MDYRMARRAPEEPGVVASGARGRARAGRAGVSRGRGGACSVALPTHGGGPTRKRTLSQKGPVGCASDGGPGTVHGTRER